MVCTLRKIFDETYLYKRDLDRREYVVLLTDFDTMEVYLCRRCQSEGSTQIESPGNLHQMCSEIYKDGHSPEDDLMKLLFLF